MKPFPPPAIDIIGFPMDLGAGRRGVDMGPSAMRIAGLSERLAAIDCSVNDLGDVPVEIRERQAVGDPRLKYLEEIVRASGELAKIVRKSLEDGRLPLCIGGDHSMALGSIAGIADFCRADGRTPGVIWIDAHADMNTHETTPSGNIHGMPMAAALGLGHERLTHLLGFAPKVRPENAVLIGMRDLDPPEKALIRSVDLPVFTMNHIDRRGLADIVDTVLPDLARRVDHLHVSFDLDAVDPSVVRGVGTPVPGGLTYREAHLLMETIAECRCMKSLEISEVNPILDRGNQSAEFGAALIASAFGMRIL